MKRTFLAIFLVLISSVSFAQEAGSPVKFQKANGQFKFAQCDNDGNIKVATDITEWKNQVATLSENVAKTITSKITGKRKFIKITSQTTNKTFWITTDGTVAVISECWPVNTSIYIEAPSATSISVIASEALRLSVMEGGY